MSERAGVHSNLCSYTGKGGEAVVTHGAPAWGDRPTAAYYNPLSFFYAQPNCHFSLYDICNKLANYLEIIFTLSENFDVSA